MKKTRLSLTIIASALAVIGIGASVTLAANYVNPAESYTFNASSPNSFSTFSIGHYFHGGTGANANNAFLITNPIEMRNLAKLQNYGLLGSTTYYFKLNNSFTWYGDDMEPIGTYDRPFKGVFKGNGMTISGVKITSNQTQSGLFGVIQSAEIENLILSGPYLTCTKASSVAGFVAGVDKGSSSFTNVFVHGGSEDFEKRADVHANAGASITLNAADSRAFVLGTHSSTSFSNTGFVQTVEDDTAITASKVDASVATTASVSAGKTYRFYADSSYINAYDSNPQS